MRETSAKWVTTLYIIGVVVVAFGGVVIGNWIVNWRNANATAEIQRDYSPEKVRILNEGNPFPDIYLTNCNGDSINSSAIINGTNTAILFLSPECSPCEKACKLWMEYSDMLPSDLNVIGISNSEYKFTCEYIENIGFPFPVYCDSEHLLAIDFGISRYPAAMGIRSDGIIAVPDRGLYNDFSPLDAYDLILGYIK